MILRNIYREWFLLRSFIPMTVACLGPEPLSPSGRVGSFWSDPRIVFQKTIGRS